MAEVACPPDLAPDLVSPVGLTDRTDQAITEALAGRRRGLRALLPFAGPAFVASVAYMDPGNFATNIQAGARYGYTLLWVVVLANAVAMLFQALSAKLGIVTGHNLAELCRMHFRARWCWRCGASARSRPWPRTWRSSSAVRSACRCCSTCRCWPAW